MIDLESELSLALAKPRAAGDAGVVARIRLVLERRERLRRSRAVVAAAGVLAAAVASGLLVWKLADTALSAFDVNRGTDVLLWLPFVAVIAILGVVACTISAAIVRSVGVRNES